jgi:hypothetical protein
MVAPSKMDGSKPPDWTGFPENENDFPEQVELSDSDSDNIWPSEDYFIEALRNQQISHFTARNWNESINNQMNIVRREHRRDRSVRIAESRNFEHMAREQREQSIRIRRYQRMRSEIVSINRMSNPAKEDIDDLRDLLQSSTTLYSQIGEHIRKRREFGFRY